MKRLRHTRASRVVIGISGGLDSTLALLATIRAFDRLALPRDGITAITMPGFGTTSRTYDNALSLMRLLGVTMREIPIRDAVRQLCRQADGRHATGGHLRGGPAHQPGILRRRLQHRRFQSVVGPVQGIQRRGQRVPGFVFGRRRAGRPDRSRGPVRGPYRRRGTVRRR